LDQLYKRLKRDGLEGGVEGERVQDRERSMVRERVQVREGYCGGDCAGQEEEYGGGRVHVRERGMEWRR